LSTVVKRTGKYTERGTQNLTRSSRFGEVSHHQTAPNIAEPRFSDLNATKGEPVRLSVGIAVHARHGVIEVPLPSTRRIHLRRRPKVRVVRAIVVITIGIAVARRLSA